MKAPAFQWYAAEYLADERVAQLSLESEAVYVRLLSYCWREGTIPSNPVQCAPLCKYADVKVIKPALTLFMRAPGQPGRLIHKRLEGEREKQQAFKDKQVINGKLGGRPRKPNDNPDESQTKGLGYSGLTQIEPKKRSSTSTSFTTEEQPMSDSATPSPDELDFEVFWDGYGRKEGAKGKMTKQWAGLKLATRQIILNGLNAYRQAKTVNGPQFLPMPQTFLNGKLWEAETYGTAALLPPAARIIPPMPEDPCSLWGAPNPDYDHRNYSQTAGQYTGIIQ